MPHIYIYIKYPDTRVGARAYTNIDITRLKEKKELFENVPKPCEFTKLATCIIVLTLTLLKLLFDFRSGVRLQFLLSFKKWFKL